MTPRGWSVRIRLTLSYGFLVLISGAVLLSAVYLLLDRGVSDQAVVGGQTGAVEPPELPEPLEPAEPVGSQETPAEIKRRQAEFEQQLRDEVRERTVAPTIEGGLVVLGGLTVAGLAVGWVAAGRTLRPINRITTTARRIADRNLHERIALSGPRDEWRDLADTFDGMLSRLDAAFEGQRQFVANASHELKTPLAINRTLLEVAMNRPNAPAGLHELGATLLEVNARHEKVVDGLLTLVRSERAITHPVLVDLAEIAAGTGDVVRDEANRLGVTVTLDTNPAMVTADPVLLEQMVQNLVQNAVRHNVSGGWVRVSTERAGNSARLAVTNTGAMLSATAIPALFEPFHRATNRIDSARGNGLGLSIVRSVVRAHGGEVVATPRDGGGMSVEVTLPAG
jgi:signal transduction histidine kinase